MASGVSVTVGVDTHVGVALDQAGRRLGEVAVSNDESGYRGLLRWGLAASGSWPALGLKGQEATVRGSHAS
jgi:hypothetical protein